MRVRVFIDFWNFQLNWNDRMDPQKCDWRALPRATVAQAALLLQPMGVADPLILEETLLYASIDPTTETALKDWLTNTIDRMPSYRVRIRERRSRGPRPSTAGSVEPSSTDAQSATLATLRDQRRAFDTAIVTDLLSLAFQQSYDLAILVSSDADFIPAVEYLQNVGLKVINAGWSKRGHDLKRACWASFDLERVAVNIVRR